MKNEPPIPPRSSPLNRLGEFLALRGGMAGMLLVCILLGMGENMAERFLPIYILALGGGTLAVGAVNGLDNLLSSLYSYPGGWLAGRIGPRRALLAFNLIAIAGYVLVIFVPHWPAVLAGSALFLSWSAISMPATMGIVAGALPASKRTMGVSMHSMVRRIPMAIGPIIGGLCIARWGERDGVRAAFGVSIALAVAAIIVQQRMIPADPPRNPDRPKGPDGRARIAFLLPPAVRRLLISDILVRFCEQIPYGFIAIWCMKTIPHPVTAVQFGVLTAVEMVTAMLVYVPVAYLADRGRKKPFVVMTFINFTLFPAALFFAHSFWPLVAVFIVRGLKEFGEPSRKALIMDLSPEDHKSEAFGLYYLLRDLIVSIAAFGGGFLWLYSPALNLFTAAAFGVAGTAWFALRGTDRHETAPQVGAL